MLEILPIENKDTQKKICEICKIEFLPDMLAYSALSDGSICGICQFKLTEKGGSVHSIAVTGEHIESDYQILFTLGRAALNFIDLCGVHDAYFDGNVTDEALIGDIGFRKNDHGDYYMNLEGFFTSSPCKNCNEDK